MADVKKIATRMGYGAALRELGALHDNIVVFDADLAGSTQTATFGKAFPDRHFNCGIAEGNMMAAAAGAAALAAWLRGEEMDAGALEPVYLRLPQAERELLKRQGK